MIADRCPEYAGSVVRREGCVRRTTPGCSRGRCWCIGSGRCAPPRCWARTEQRSVMRAMSVRTVRFRWLRRAVFADGARPASAGRTSSLSAFAGGAAEECSTSVDRAMKRVGLAFKSDSRPIGARSPPTSIKTRTEARKRTTLTARERRLARRLRHECSYRARRSQSLARDGAHRRDDRLAPSRASRRSIGRPCRTLWTARVALGRLQ